MCIFRSMPQPRPIQLPASDNREAFRQASIEARLRRRRAGAAANVLTGPSGIPSVRRMGEVAS